MYELKYFGPPNPPEKNVDNRKSNRKGIGYKDCITKWRSITCAALA